MGAKLSIYTLDFLRSLLSLTHFRHDCHHAYCTKKSMVLTLGSAFSGTARWDCSVSTVHGTAFMEGRKRFRSRSLCIIDATLQSVLHLEDTLLYTFVDVRPWDFLFMGRATSLYSGLSRKHGGCLSFFSSSALHFCNTWCVRSPWARSKSSAPAASIDPSFSNSI